MPAWAFIPLILVATLACPISMWVMGKVTRRKMSHAACGTSTQEENIHTAKSLEARKAALEREIAEVKKEKELHEHINRSAVQAKGHDSGCHCH